MTESWQRYSCLEFDSVYVVIFVPWRRAVELREREIKDNSSFRSVEILVQSAYTPLSSKTLGFLFKFFKEYVPYVFE